MNEERDEGIRLTLHQSGRACRRKRGRFHQFSTTSRRLEEEKKNSLFLSERTGVRPRVRVGVNEMDLLSSSLSRNSSSRVLKRRRKGQLKVWEREREAFQAHLVQRTEVSSELELFVERQVVLPSNDHYSNLSTEKSTEKRK